MDSGNYKLTTADKALYGAMMSGASTIPYFGTKLAMESDLYDNLALSDNFGSKAGAVALAGAGLIGGGFAAFGAIKGIKNTLPDSLHKKMDQVSSDLDTSVVNFAVLTLVGLGLFEESYDPKDKWVTVGAGMALGALGTVLSPEKPKDSSSIKQADNISPTSFADKVTHWREHESNKAIAL